jgi:hypothetical protein
MYMQKIHFSLNPNECMKVVNLSIRSIRIPRYAYNGSNYPSHRPIDGIVTTGRNNPYMRYLCKTCVEHVTTPASNKHSP